MSLKSVHNMFKTI